MRQKILLIGAGLSTQQLVPYLKKRIETHQWELRIVDRDEVMAAKRLGKAIAHTSSGSLDIQDEQALIEEIKGCQLVISMVPAHMHLPVAKMCLKFRSHLVTASYATPAMHELDADAQRKGLIFLNECGLDPGIDHMSAMKLLDAIRSDGGKVVLFESFTGGLLSAASEVGNPWRYKFT